MRADAACDAAVSLCARLRSRGGHLEDSGHLDQPDPRYKELVVAYVRSYAANLDTLPAWARAVLTRQMKHVAQRAGHVESMLKHVIVAFQDVPARDMKDVLVLLLGVGDFEASKLELAAAIAQRDVSVALQTAYRACSTGR